MVGCNKYVNYADKETLCSDGWNVCTVREYDEQLHTPSPDKSRWLKGHWTHTDSEGRNDMLSDFDDLRD